MAEAQLQQFLEKVRQLNAFVALSEADPAFRQRLRDCASHQEVVELASSCGFDIARRWGEPPTRLGQPETMGISPGDSGQQVTPALTGPGGHQGPGQFCQDQASQDRVSQDQASQDQPPKEASPQVSSSPVVGSKVPCPIKPPAQDASPLAAQDAGFGFGLNLLSGPCPAAGQERIDPLLVAGPLRLELIHSCAFANPPGFWYDQSESEWVMLLQGSAQLRFADESEVRQLHPGDSLLISPGRRHRVEATDLAPGTRWLALFWSESG
jgi:hypothetical protein